MLAARRFAVVHADLVLAVEFETHVQTGLRQLFGLRDEEQALCFLSIGTPKSRKSARQRPAPGDYVSTLGPSGAPVPDF